MTNQEITNVEDIQETNRNEMELESLFNMCSWGFSFL